MYSKLSDDANTPSDEPGHRKIKRVSDIPQLENHDHQLSQITIDFRGNEKVSEDHFLKLTQNITPYRQNLNRFKINLSRCRKLSGSALIELNHALSEMKNLEELFLNFEDCNDLTDDSLTEADIGAKSSTILGCISFSSRNQKQNVPNLTKILPQMVKLSKFGISFAGCGGIRNNGIIELGKAFIQLPSLIELQIDISRCKIEDKALYSLYKSIGLLKCLINLHINAESSDISYKTLLTEPEVTFFSSFFCFSQSSDERRGLGHTIAELSTLRLLDINLSSNENIEDNGILGIGRGLSAKKSVNELLLNLAHCAHLTEPGLIVMMKYVRKLKELIKFDLNLTGLEAIGDAFLIKTSEAMDRFQKLETLCLKLKDCEKITSLGLDKFAECVSKLKSIKNIELNFDNCFQKDDGDGFILMASHLAQMQSLKSLRLHLAKYENIKEKGMLKLSSVLKSNLMSLETLHLDFSGVFGIDDSCIFVLTKSIKGLTKLKSLKLAFAQNFRVKDQSLIILSDCIMKIENVRNLSLDISHCKEITDQGIMNIGKAIALMKKVMTLTLMLENTNEFISDQSLIAIAKGISKINRITKVSLDCSNWKQLSDPGVISLLNYLENNENLEELSLGFVMCEKLTGNSIQELEKFLAKKVSLVNAKLDFRYCLGIKGAQITDMKMALDKVDHLSKLEVDFI